MSKVERGPEPATATPWILPDERGGVESRVWSRSQRGWLVARVRSWSHPQDALAIVHRVNNWDALCDERDALAEQLGECGKILGAIVCAGTLAVGETMTDPPDNAAVRAIIDMAKWRDVLAAEVDRLNAKLEDMERKRAEVIRQMFSSCPG